MDIIIVFINVLCGEKIYYIKYSRLFSHSINSRYVVQSIKNIFKQSGVAGEIQLGAGAIVSGVAISRSPVPEAKKFLRPQHQHKLQNLK